MADFPAEQFIPDDFGYILATPADIPVEQLIPDDGGGIIAYFEMRGIDSGTSTYTTWVATSPDPNGLQATPLNTTPALVGAIVAGSGFVLVNW